MKDEKRSKQPEVPAEAGAETPANMDREDNAADEAEKVRDFAAEVAELIREFPEAGKNGGLPDEVVEAVTRAGKTVLEAYRDYALSHAGEEEPPRAAKKRAGAGNAPVKGVSGGWPVGDQTRDPFMAGFGED